MQLVSRNQCFGAMSTYEMRMVKTLYTSVVIPAPSKACLVGACPSPA